MSEPLRPSEDARWLRSVRADLDSEAESWVVKPKPDHHGVSKLQAIGAYLDTLLTDLGYPTHGHKCSVCGMAHVPKPKS